MTETRVPGFLYAKSLQPGERPGEAYRTWFRHADLARHEALLADLRTCFHWVSAADRRHPPVVLVESVPEPGKALVVRFSDAGKDPFGRSQTLRMEALLVSTEDVANYWDGTFRAEPDAESACFLTESATSAREGAGGGGRCQLIGVPGTFSFGGLTRSESKDYPRMEDRMVWNSVSSRVPPTPESSGMAPGSDASRAKTGRGALGWGVAGLLAAVCAVLLATRSGGDAADGKEKRTDIERTAVEHYRTSIAKDFPASARILDFDREAAQALEAWYEDIEAYHPETRKFLSNAKTHVDFVNQYVFGQTIAKVNTP
jgi:hypothetical protein